MQDAYGIRELSRVRGQETMEIGILNPIVRLSITAFDQVYF